MSLHEALVSQLAEVGVTNAAINLFGGSFGRVSYCLAAPRQGATQVAGYTEPERCEGRFSLVMSGVTLGHDEACNPLVHCHALLAGQCGHLFGGHIVPHETITSDDPPVAFVRSLDGILVQRRFDAETDMALFHPVSGPGGADGILCH